MGWRVNLAGFRMPGVLSPVETGPAPSQRRGKPRLSGKSAVPLDFRGDRYPLTLILENDSTAVPAVDRPIESAGCNVVIISSFFNCGSTALASSGCDRMRYSSTPP